MHTTAGLVLIGWLKESNAAPIDESPKVLPGVAQMTSAEKLSKGEILF